ncbi:HAMP domain-containing histidine kinase [Paenibacillus sp. P25]|nr:HAMP domain-containing histidine kinase [Paenibacillus sp. P25]
MIDSILASVKPLHENGVRIVKQYDVDGTLICDELHVREVLNNVCLNALEALPPKNGFLHIGTQMCKGDLYIVVKDNGHGIPKENLDKIFDPFFTTKKTRAATALASATVMRSCTSMAAVSVSPIAR